MLFRNVLSQVFIVKHNLIVNYNINRVVFFSKMTWSSPIRNQDLEQEKLVAAVNSR